jgi:hypothetical protein
MNLAMIKCFSFHEIKKTLDITYVSLIDLEHKLCWWITQRNKYNSYAQFTEFNSAVIAVPQLIFLSTIAGF